jgi:hypothetical protein
MSKADVSYPPLDVPKPIAKNSGPLRVMGLIPLPVRMTIIRLADGGLLLHSPTRFDFDLARELEKIGPIRYLVAPNSAHWMCGTRSSETACRVKPERVIFTHGSWLRGMPPRRLERSLAGC